MKSFNAENKSVPLSVCSSIYVPYWFVREHISDYFICVLPCFQLCGKEFNRMHNLMGHMHLHSDSRPFKCLYCSSKFTLKGNLTRHMKVKHGIMDRGLDARGNY